MIITAHNTKMVYYATEGITIKHGRISRSLMYFGIKTKYYFTTVTSHDDKTI